MNGFEIGGIRITIDPSTLREQVSDPQALAAWCASHPSDPLVVAALRMLQRLDEAETAGRRALDEEGLQPLSRAVRRARLAHVLHWQGRFEEADEEFVRAAEETGQTGDPNASMSQLALASVLQHRAKSRLDHAASTPARAPWLLASASEDAERALALRITCGAPEEQIESTRLLVAHIDARSARSGVEG